VGDPPVPLRVQTSRATRDRRRARTSGTPPDPDPAVCRRHGRV